MYYVLGTSYQVLGVHGVRVAGSGFYFARPCTGHSGLVNIPLGCEGGKPKHLFSGSGFYFANAGIVYVISGAGQPLSGADYSSLHYWGTNTLW